MVTCLAYCLDRELWKAIEYLKEQVKVLKEQQEKDKRILLDNRQRMKLAGKRYLIHDRDPLYTAKFDSILKAAGVEPVKLPPRSPNLNACAERFVRSIKEECLSQLILSSEEQLRYVLSEYLEYYHHERIHQGLNRIIEPQHEGHQGDIICIERLGGLLRSYHRKAA
jgi:putative transposase